MNKMFQSYHLVTYSPWPLLMSFSVLIMLVGVLNWFYSFSIYLMLIGLMISLLILYQWWRDVVRESTYQGFHTFKVVQGLKMGMLLFILSEVSFLLEFFDVTFMYFFHLELKLEEIDLFYINTFNPYGIPLLNTILLLSSEVSMTYCHYSLLFNNYKDSFISLMFTVILGLIFTLFQYYEYIEASFTISDSIDGSIFFMLTGFHRLHVLIGSIYLMINLLLIYKLNYSSLHHMGFEAAAWYWHFVDVVCLFLYLLMYFWFE